MRKIKLELEALEVESFPTASGGDAERGTVRGQASGLGCPTDPDCTGGGVDPSYSADGGCVCQAMVAGW